MHAGQQYGRENDMVGMVGALARRYMLGLAGIFLFAWLILLHPLHAGAATFTVSNCSDSDPG
jgi:hypothetical protein